MQFSWVVPPDGDAGGVQRRMEAQIELESPTVEQLVDCLRSSDADERNEALIALLDICEQAYGEDGRLLGSAMRQDNGTGLSLLCWLLADSDPEVVQRKPPACPRCSAPRISPPRRVPCATSCGPRALLSPLPIAGTQRRSSSWATCARILLTRTVFSPRLAGAASSPTPQSHPLPSPQSAPRVLARASPAFATPLPALSLAQRALLSSGSARAFFASISGDDEYTLMFACGALQNLCHDPLWSEMVLRHGVDARLEQLCHHANAQVVRRPRRRRR